MLPRIWTVQAINLVPPISLPRANTRRRALRHLCYAASGRYAACHSSPDDRNEYKNLHNLY
jgi:hypothetical protein